MKKINRIVNRYIIVLDESFSAGSWQIETKSYVWRGSKYAFEVAHT